MDYFAHRAITVPISVEASPGSHMKLPLNARCSLYLLGFVRGPACGVLISKCFRADRGG